MRPEIGTAGLALVLSAFAAVASGQDLDRGARKSLQCVACHGPNGITPNPTFPHIAGQNATYLLLQLENFREGDRYDPLMTPIAESLTDSDIRDLAAYFSRIGPLAAVEPPITAELSPDAG